MKWFRREEGQTLVLTALCASCLIGFMALAVDVGLVFRSQRNLQIAADAAATAAALDYFYNSGGVNPIAAAKTVGTNAAIANGVDTSKGATITINDGNGSNITTPWHNSAGYFEAILSEPSPMAFMGYFGIGSMTVKARAVAGTPGANTKSCIYVLNPTGTLGPGKSGGDSTVWLQGSFQLNAPNCGISIDGTSSDTLYYEGNGGSTSAAWIGVVGGAGGKYSSYSPQPVTGVAPVTDPLNAYTVPTASSCTSTTTAVTGTIGTTGGITCASGTSFTNATFQGTVIFTTTSTVMFNGNISSGTGGTTMVFPTEGFDEGSNTVFNLSPRTDGALPNVVLAAPVTNTSTSTIQFGSSSGTFNGIVYMPGETFYFQDSGGDHSGGLTFNINLVVGQLDDKTTTLNINGYSPPAGTPNPLALVALVE